MKYRRSNNNDNVYIVQLNKTEWPAIDVNDDTWLDRPIRTWVNNCGWRATFFCYNGEIFFYDEALFTQFWLTWHIEE